MYAIILDSGRQIKVEEGQELQVDYRDAKKGDALTFSRVLACGGEQGLRIGKPELPGAKVEAEVTGIVQGPKLVVQKMRRRKNSRRKNGHRQIALTVKISKITA